MVRFPSLIAVCITLAALAASGCDAWSPAARTPIADLDTAAARLSEIAGAPVRGFASYDAGRQQDANSRSVVVPAASADRVLEELRGELGPGLVAYMSTTMSAEANAVPEVEVVVTKGDSQFDILRRAHTVALVDDLSADDLIQRLRQLDEHYGIDIVRADRDAVEFKVHDLPDDLAELSREIGELSPAAVEPRPEGLETFEEELSRQRRVLLQWK